MIKQGNIFQEDITELTPIEKVELEVKRKNEILEYLGIETKRRKHKKITPIPITTNKYVRCDLGIFKVDYIMNKHIMVEDIFTKRKASLPIKFIQSVGDDPYMLLDKDDVILIKTENVIRTNVIYDTFKMKNGELRFLVMDKEDGEVIDITIKEIVSIKEINRKDSNI